MKGRNKKEKALGDGPGDVRQMRAKRWPVVGGAGVCGQALEETQPPLFGPAWPHPVPKVLSGASFRSLTAPAVTHLSA